MSEQVFIAVITAAAACVTAMWRVLRSYQIKTEAKLEKIDEHRNTLLTEVANLRHELGKVQGFQDGVERLAKDLLREISERPCKGVGESAVRHG
jgi:uncharacterized protein YlxW (UPF0749 family)